MSEPTTDARERLLAAAYELFSRHGVQAVGIDAIIERSGVARQTLYRHFASKQDLVLAFLQRRERVWTYEWLDAEVRRRARKPHRRLLAIFDVFDEWFHSPGFEGCSFINVMLEHPTPDHPLHRAAAAHLAQIRGLVAELAAQAHAADPELLARQWHILMKGSIIAAHEGDHDAAIEAKQLGALLLERSSLPAGARERARRGAAVAGSRTGRRAALASTPAGRPRPGRS